jgi:WD40 repeat protein
MGRVAHPRRTRRASFRDAQTGMSVATFKGPSSFSKGLAFSPRSKTLASGHAEGRIYLIDARPAP